MEINGVNPYSNFYGNYGNNYFIVPSESLLYSIPAINFFPGIYFSQEPSKLENGYGSSQCYSNSNLDQQQVQKMKSNQSLPIIEDQNIMKIQHQEQSEYKPQNLCQGSQDQCVLNKRYSKKNTQSNTVNQIFSFISTPEKSKKILQTIYEGQEKKTEVYFQVMKTLKKSNKKYINRKYLVGLVQLKPKHIGYRILTKNPIRPSKNRFQPLSVHLTVEEFRKGARMLMIYFLRHFCTESIVTSKKLNKETWQEHLQRRRQVLQYIVKYSKSNVDPIDQDY